MRLRRRELTKSVNVGGDPVMVSLCKVFQDHHMLDSLLYSVVNIASLLYSPWFCPMRVDLKNFYQWNDHTVQAKLEFTSEKTLYPGPYKRDAFFIPKNLTINL